MPDYDRCYGGKKISREGSQGGLAERDYIKVTMMIRDYLKETVTFEQRNEGGQVANMRTRKDSCQLKILQPKFKILRKVGRLG